MSYKPEQPQQELEQTLSFLRRFNRAFVQQQISEEVWQLAKEAIAPGIRELQEPSPHFIDRRDHSPRVYHTVPFHD